MECIHIFGIDLSSDHCHMHKVAIQESHRNRANKSKQAVAAEEKNTAVAFTIAVKMRFTLFGAVLFVIVVQVLLLSFKLEQMPCLCASHI